MPVNSLLLLSRLLFVSFQLRVDVRGLFSLRPQFARCTAPSAIYLDVLLIFRIETQEEITYFLAIGHCVNIRSEHPDMLHVRGLWLNVSTYGRSGFTRTNIFQGWIWSRGLHHFIANYHCQDGIVVDLVRTVPSDSETMANGSNFKMEYEDGCPALPNK